MKVTISLLQLQLQLRQFPNLSQIAIETISQSISQITITTISQFHCKLQLWQFPNFNFFFIRICNCDNFPISNAFLSEFATATISQFSLLFYQTCILRQFSNFHCFFIRNCNCDNFPFLVAFLSELARNFKSDSFPIMIPFFIRVCYFFLIRIHQKLQLRQFPNSNFFFYQSLLLLLYQNSSEIATPTVFQF